MAMLSENWRAAATVSSSSGAWPMMQTMAQSPLAGLAGGAVYQLLAVAGVHGELYAADEVAHGRQCLRVGYHVVGHVQHVPDLGGEAGRVAVAEGGDVQGTLLRAEGGDELAGEVDLAGVACLMARRSFQQLQQGQAGE